MRLCEGLETVRGKGSEVHGRRSAFEQISEDCGGGGGEQDSIAKMAGGKEMRTARMMGADEREMIHRSGPKACPGFELRCGSLVSECGQKLRGVGTELREIGEGGGGVEAGVFDGCADERGTGLRAPGAGDDVDVFAAVDFGKWKFGGELDAEHLSFDRACVGRVPGATRLDELSRFEVAAVGFDAKMASVGFGNDAGLGVLAKIDTGGADSREKCCGKLARVEGEFGEAIRAAVVGVLHGACGLEGYGHSGEMLDATEVLAVKRGAQSGEIP